SGGADGDWPEAEPESQGRAESDPEEAFSSPNDELWQRAERTREPQSGGVTTSGLPQRVPRANLVEGAAEETPQEGPSVSRAPEDVRGRLSNLHRGVRRGRDVGSSARNDR